jgi:hypothetical protein
MDGEIFPATSVNSAFFQWWDLRRFALPCVIADRWTAEPGSPRPIETETAPAYSERTVGDAITDRPHHGGAPPVAAATA